MVRIGILGVAHLHVDTYAGNLRAAGAEVVGVHDVDAVRGAGWRGARHGVPFFADLDELLATGLDGVVVCSETALHVTMVEAAARAGLAVLCERSRSGCRPRTRSGSSTAAARPMSA